MTRTARIPAPVIILAAVLALAGHGGIAAAALIRSARQFLAIY